jgi:hypothetical protein
MDYAAALRASPAGPAVRLDTTPLAKAQPQKAPSPKPAKVEAEETVHIIEEETVPTAAIASVPSKPPSNAGLSPIVRFVLRVPAAASSDKDVLVASSEVNAESSDSDSETEEDAGAAAGTNGAKSKSSSTEAKAPVFSAQDLDNVRYQMPIFASTIFSHSMVPWTPTSRAFPLGALLWPVGH